MCLVRTTTDANIRKTPKLRVVKSTGPSATLGSALLNCLNYRPPKVQDPDDLEHWKQHALMKKAQMLIRKLIEKLQLVEQRLEAKDGGTFNLKDRSRGSLVAELEWINALIRRYPRIPSLEIGYEGEAALWTERRSRGEPVDAEVAAVRDVEVLADAGLIRNLMECACGCRMWFLSKREDHRCFNAACRHRLYERTPEARERRQDYNRAYYQENRSSVQPPPKKKSARPAKRKRKAE